jgi:hypothetical protein
MNLRGTWISRRKVAGMNDRAEAELPEDWSPGVEQEQTKLVEGRITLDFEQTMGSRKNGGANPISV